MGHKAPNHPGIAAVLSFFIPGLGQLYCGRLGMAALLFAGSVAVPLTILFIAFAVLSASINRGSDPIGALGVVYILGYGTGVCCWFWNIVDAYSNANSGAVSSRRMRGGRRRGGGGGGRRKQTSRRMRREEPPEALSDEEVERFASDPTKVAPTAPRKRRRRRR